MRRKATTSDGVSVAEVKELLALFWPERALYLISVLASIIVAVFFAYQAYTSDNFEYSQIVEIFGPSGMAAAAYGRLMKMWNDAVKMIQGSN